MRTGSKIRALARSLDASWFAPALMMITLTIASWAAIWAIIEPADVPQQLPYEVLHSRLLWHLLTSILIGTVGTLGTLVVVRLLAGTRVPLTDAEFHRFHDHIAPLLRTLAEATAGTSPASVRRLVEHTVDSVVQLHFGIDRLPSIDTGMPAFPAGASAQCSLCGTLDAPITRTGQCDKCGLHCARWLGLHKPSDHQRRDA